MFYNSLMSDLVNQVVKNTRQIDSNFSQRRHAVVRVCGEEHYAAGTGSADIFLTLDNDMAYISEMKFKLVFGSGAGGGSMPTPSGADVIRGYNTWATPDAFFAQYPEGTAIDVDGIYGAQCVDYANALWLGQVNRAIQSGDGTARGIWTISRTVNAGSEFDLITDFSQLRKGDVVVWGNGTYGHIAVAAGAPSNGQIEVWGQNQGGIPWYSGGAAVNLVTFSSAGFLGAFRYRNWN